jgi:hypothetical protein
MIFAVELGADRSVAGSSAYFFYFGDIYRLAAPGLDEFQSRPQAYSFCDFTKVGWQVAELNVQFVKHDSLAGLVVKSTLQVLIIKSNSQERSFLKNTQFLEF